MKSELGNRRRRWLIGALASLAVVASGSAAASTTPPALGVHLLSAPVRVLDTRTGIGAPAARLGAGQFVDILVKNVPDDTKAVMVTVTAIGGTTGSYLKAYSARAAAPRTAAVQFPKGATVGSTTTVPLGTSHLLRILNQFGSVDVTVDLLAYLTPAGGDGPQGPMGVQGPAGADGPMGLPGVSSGPTGSVYLAASNSSEQVIHRGPGNVLAFDTKQAAMGDVDFSAGTGTFTVGSTGVYKVTFWSLADQDRQFQLRVNGQVPSMGLVVFPALAHEGSYGIVVLNLQAGDHITIENVTSIGNVGENELLDLVDGDVVLSTFIGGTAGSLNASLVIEQLNNP